MNDETVDDPEVSSAGAENASPPQSLVLVVLSPTGTGSITVPVQGTLVLGRAADCDVRIEDTKLSRRHAELRCGTTIFIVDLGSRNGTYIRDARVAPNSPTPVRVGDAITIGGTLLTLQRGAGGGRPRHVWSHGYFEARLEEECARSAREGLPFAIVRLRFRAAPSTATVADSSAEARALFDELDGADVLASYAPNDYEALFLRTAAVDVDARVASLKTRLTSEGVGFTLAIAVFPRDGRTPEALVEHTSLALRRQVAGDREPARSTTVAPSGAIERMDPILRRVARGVINVLVLGETGVGKDVLARRIHELSPRAKMPFVAINCGALSESLLEAELFGHEKGAFTGALHAKAGLIESGNGGTVFLDEIGEIPLTTAVKLLRVLEQREVTRVGAVRPRVVDVRFIAATNRNLELEIAAGSFRQDLYFRLNGIALSLPPLRERVDEIEQLALLFIDQACRASAREDRPRLDPLALAALQQYPWPGNIRELRNVMERAVLFSGHVIMREHLPAEKIDAAFPPPRPPPGPTWFTALPAPSSGLGRIPTIPPPATDAPDDERSRLIDALESCGGNQSQAAKLLGISRATLIRRIEEYAIRRPRKRV